MTIRERIESFSELGRILREILSGSNTRYSSEFGSLINEQHLKNPWFTPENVWTALKAIADELNYENLVAWTNMYPLLNETFVSRNIGVVMAGNIPLAGFHDFLSVLITGNNVLAKTSSKDRDLIVFIGRILWDINRVFEKKTTFTDGLLKDFDAVIATGSNNSSRYFEYYFRNYPHIIRRNRNGIAVIRGDEDETDISGLGQDVFTYFGLGCRSVSKIFLPADYNIPELISGWTEFSSVADHNKYANNYDYNKAILMVNSEKFLDTGYLILKESDGISSPVSVLYYQFYKSLQEVREYIKKNDDKIQCVVSREDVPFGRAQFPKLWDYADGVDTIDFLLKKN